MPSKLVNKFLFFFRCQELCCRHAVEIAEAGDIIHDCVALLIFPRKLTGTYKYGIDIRTFQQSRGGEEREKKSESDIESKPIRSLAVPPKVRKKASFNWIIWLLLRGAVAPDDGDNRKVELPSNTSRIKVRGIGQQCCPSFSDQDQVPLHDKNRNAINLASLVMPSPRHPSISYLSYFFVSLFFAAVKIFRHLVRNCPCVPRGKYISLTWEMVMSLLRGRIRSYKMTSPPSFPSSSPIRPHPSPPSLIGTVTLVQVPQNILTTFPCSSHPPEMMCVHA